MTATVALPLVHVSKSAAREVSGTVQRLDVLDAAFRAETVTCSHGSDITLAPFQVSGWFKKLAPPGVYMSRYEFSGKIEQGRGVQNFSRKVEAESLKHAREKIYATLGSEHSVPRSKIEIEEEEEE